MDIEQQEVTKAEGSGGFFSKINLNDFTVKDYSASSNEKKESRRLQVERFADDLQQNSKSDLIKGFIALYDQGFKPQRETLFDFTQEVFSLMQFQKVHEDRQKKQLVFKGTKNISDIYLQFIIDEKSELISMMVYSYHQQNSFDVSNHINKDIILALINLINDDMPQFTFEYSQQKHTIQCNTSTLGQLDENFVSWLVLNVDAVIIAIQQANITLQQMYQNGKEGPHQTIILAQKCSKKIKNKVDENKAKYDGLLEDIKTEFKKENFKQ